MEEELEKLRNDYQNLYNKILNLYVGGELEKYFGLSDDLALCLVSNIINVNEQTLIDLKEEQRKRKKS